MEIKLQSPSFVVVFFVFAVLVLVLVVKVETLLVGSVAVAPTDAECWTRREL